MAQCFSAGHHAGAAEFFERGNKGLISADPAAPQVDLLNAPAAEQFGPLQQARAIDASAESDLARCAVGHQVQFIAGVGLQPGGDGCNGVLARLHCEQTLAAQGQLNCTAIF